MKIIDLLNKIANEEEIPKKIKVNNMFVYEYDNGIDYKTKDGAYLFDSYIQITNEDMNMEVEILEEEKKIPLKINKIVPSQNYVISDSKNNSVDERLEIIRKRLYANELYMLDIANTLNEIIDYFKSKGDE